MAEPTSPNASGARRVIAFAHRGGMAHRPANTLEAFVNAAALGARAVETDAWLTRDGVVVLDHDGMVEIDGVDVDIAALDRADLPRHIPSLDDFYAACGTDVDLSIDVKDAAAAAPIIEAARRAGGDAIAHLWLCHWDVDVLAGWRSQVGAAHLVHSAEPEDIAVGIESHIRRLTVAGIEVLNLRDVDCAPAIADLCHAAGIRLFGWDAHDAVRIERLLTLGVDGIYSNDVGLMLAGVAAAGLEMA